MVESRGAEARRLLRKPSCCLVLLFALLGAGAVQSDDSSGGPKILLFRVLPTIDDGVHWHEFHWEVANTHRVRLFQNGTENPGRTQLTDGSTGWPLSMSGALRMRLKATATLQLVAEDQAGNSVSESQVAEVQTAGGLKTAKTAAKKTTEKTTGAKETTKAAAKKTKPPLAGSQGFVAANVSDQTELSHGGDFFDDHIVVDGTIKNIGPKRFPCLMVVFGFDTSQGRKQDALMIRDLGSGEKRPYSQRFSSANSVWHVSTLTCAPAETDIPVEHCTVTGELLAQRGFIQRVADHPNDPGTIYRLNEVLLIRGGDVIDRAPLGPGETVRSFHFKRVPVGETFQVGLGFGWAFQGFEQVRVQCGQPSGTQNLGRKQIMTVGES